MKFGLIIIGDEILSGKREDKHMAKATRFRRTVNAQENKKKIIRNKFSFRE